MNVSFTVIDNDLRVSWMTGSEVADSRGGPAPRVLVCPLHSEMAPLGVPGTPTRQRSEDEWEEGETIRCVVRDQMWSLSAGTTDSSDDGEFRGTL